MGNIVRSLSTHSGRLERWLGADQVERISAAMGPWYGPDIAVGNIPGRVYARKGGDFVGRIRGGVASSYLDRLADRAARFERASRRAARRQLSQANMGFTGLSDLLAEASGGESRYFYYYKTGTTGVANSSNSLWAVGAMPAAGGNGSAAPGGRAPDDSTTGAFTFANPSSKTQHVVTSYPWATVASNTLLLYDRIFDVAKTMNSAATESVTGVPTRYQSNTSTAMDYAGGNFLFVECTTALAATAHNWTTCLYRDESGNDAQTLPSVTGNSGNIINRHDMPAGTWFCPLATGDTGIADLNQMQCSATVATGAINFVIGHPLAFLPCPVAGATNIVDGINSAFNLTRVFDDACLALAEILKPSTTATTYNLALQTVAG